MCRPYMNVKKINIGCSHLLLFPLRRGIKSDSPDIDRLLEENLHVIRAEDYSRYTRICNEALGIQ